jgi:hypothetical protein
MAQIFKAKTLVANTGKFAYEVSAPNLVYNTGDQNISGVKNFYSRPTVNGTGVLLIGEASNVTLPNTVVYTTGNQNISGIKTFANNLEVQGTGIFNALDLSNISEFSFSGTNINLINGNVNISGGTLYISGNAVLTGVNLTSYATNANLYATGSTLDNKINSLSGYVNTQDVVFSGQISSTGSKLDSKINSLSGYVNSQDIVFSGQTFNTGSILDNKINSLSGYVDSKSIVLPTTIVYTTGNQTVSGLKNFTTIPTVNGTGVLLAGATIPSTEASGAGGSIFITYVSPSGGIGNVGDYVYETPGETIGNTALISCSTTTQTVLVDIYALQGRSRFKPKLYITGQQIPLTLVERQTDRPVFLVNDFGINLNNRTSIRVDHEDGAYHTISITQDSPPQITSAYFYGGYPGSQTELKAGDTFNFHVNTDIDVVSIEIDNFGAFNASTTSVTAGTSHNLTSRVIADRGTSVQDLGARVRVQKANGSYSAWFLTTSQGSTDGQYTVKLNNLYPSVSVSTITYPGSQQALKDSESATVSNTVSSFDVISYTSPNSDLTITSSTTYQTSKTVTRSAGNYNTSTNNFRITATRNANNAVTTNSSTVVKIAHTAPTLTVSVPAARLRTGGNDGTSAQSYTVTITATQQLLSAPTLSVPAGGGTLGSFGGSTTTWTATLSNINDNLTKGTYTWGAISATNLAGKVVTTITTGPTYVIGGFLSRTVSLAAFANEVNINTSVLDYTKMTLSWVIKSLPNRRAVGTTATPDPDSWSINSLSVNPTIVRILDTAATQSSSQATNVTVEETV